jgi:hypothetical protein
MAHDVHESLQGTFLSLSTCVVVMIVQRYYPKESFLVLADGKFCSQLTYIIMNKKTTPAPIKKGRPAAPIELEDAISLCCSLTDSSGEDWLREVWSNNE